MNTGAIGASYRDDPGPRLQFARNLQFHRSDAPRRLTVHGTRIDDINFPLLLLLKILPPVVSTQTTPLDITSRAYKNPMCLRWRCGRVLAPPPTIPSPEHSTNKRMKENRNYDDEKNSSATFFAPFLRHNSVRKFFARNLVAQVF